MSEYNPRLRAVIMQVVDNQLRTSEPPETKQTYERLLAEGHSKQEAKRLIACVVATEIWEMLQRRETFDHERFAAALARLPEMPWEEEE